MKSSVKVKKKLDFVRIMRGVFFAYLLSLFLFLIMGGILYFTKLPESTIPYAVIVVSSVSIIVSGIKATSEIESMGWLHGGLIGLIYVAVLIAIGLFTIPTSTPGIATLIDLILGFVLGTIAGVIGVNM